MVSGLLVLAALSGAGAVHSSGGHVSAPRAASSAHTPCRPRGGSSSALSSTRPSGFGGDPFANLGKRSCRSCGRTARGAEPRHGDSFERTDAHPPIDLVIPAEPEPRQEVAVAAAPARDEHRPEIMVGIKNPKFILVGP